MLNLSELYFLTHETGMPIAIFCYYEDQATRGTRSSSCSVPGLLRTWRKDALGVKLIKTQPMGRGNVFQQSSRAGAHGNVRGRPGPPRPFERGSPGTGRGRQCFYKLLGGSKVRVEDDSTS